MAAVVQDHSQDHMPGHMQVREPLLSEADRRFYDEGLKELWNRQMADPPGAHLSDTGLPYLPTGFLRRGIGCYYHSASEYHLRPELAEALNEAAAYLLERQLEDGTISMIDCNFNSPPDTAFVIKSLAPAAYVARELDHEALRRARDSLLQFLERAKRPMLEGGVHTSNHRWVMVAALAWLYRLFGDRALVARADEWLAEGFDITPGGEWTERSNGGYNVVCDESLVLAAVLLQRPELLEPVQRNLEMMQYLVHPNGDVVTDYSHRQDARAKVCFSIYYTACRWMASLQRNGRFAAMADWAASLGGRSELVDMMALPQLYAEVEREPLPAQYRILMGGDGPEQPVPSRIFHYDRPRRRYTPGAHVFRLRDGEASVTVAAESEEFLSVRYGDAVLRAVRLVPAFFGAGPVRFPAIEEDGESLVLRQKLTAWYNGPLPKEHRRADGAWPLMDHARRPVDHVCSLDITVRVTFEAGGLLLWFKAEGQANVPAQVVLRFDEDGELSGEGLERVPVLESARALASSVEYQLVRGAARFVKGNHGLEVGPGRRAHTWLVLRGDIPRLFTQNVCINWLAPFDETIAIRYVLG